MVTYGAIQPFHSFFCLGSSSPPNEAEIDPIGGDALVEERSAVFSAVENHLIGRFILYGYQLQLM